MKQFLEFMGLAFVLVIALVAFLIWYSGLWVLFLPGQKWN